MMIAHENYRLRPVVQSDLQFLIDLRNHPETHKYLGTMMVLTMESQLKWLASLEGRKDRSYLMFEYRVGMESAWETIGMARLTDMDYENNSVCVGGDIAIKYRGQGHAKALYRLIFELCFNQLGFHRLWLLVLAYNDIAYSLYQKMGFVTEGRQRKAIFRDGEYHDYIMMGLLEEEYRVLIEANK